ncbi:Proline dehydrogenase 1, mitochondrial [Liparis tanakae]|uniref:Proline dehydrogenase n=1 Tax=Liparis tanakae TaxID=230148 RepID=A0A4Z2FE57_9TELE|nr:Proline dehydrogenase 1, mitochondrial [Liparis tanakae]
MSTTSRLMFITAGAGPALARAAAAAAAAERPFKRLYLSRRLRSSTPAEHDPARAARPGQPGKDGALSVDFEQTQMAYKSKDSLELLRSLVVFKLCSYDLLVEKNTEIMALGKKILGQRAFDQLMKMTFYGQFVAGEDHLAIRPLIQKNQAFGVGSVLDYSVEEDLSQEEAEQKEMEYDIFFYEILQESPQREDHREKKYKAHKQFGDRRGGVTGARTYFYADEAKCDQHMETFIKCIKASEVLVKWRHFFSFLASQQGEDGTEALEQRLELKPLQEFLTKLGAEGDMYGWFNGKKEGSPGTIDVLDWNSLIDDRTRISDLLVVPNVEHAIENGVRLMVDAEQTYFQPAISRLTLEMQRLYNKDKPVIFNTYQCYLQVFNVWLSRHIWLFRLVPSQLICQLVDACYRQRDAYDNVSMDVELSRRQGWHFAAKLVRGAYMYQERQRAKDIGYEDPINPDYETTNIMYHRCLDFVLDEIALTRNANVMVASHNEDTLSATCPLLEAVRLHASTAQQAACSPRSRAHGEVRLTRQAGFPVYKYVPYGPVSQVMPYLSRRAQENRGFMKGAVKERQLLWAELKRRLSSGELLHRPAF